MKKVGNFGVIVLEEGNTRETELDVVEGMKLDRGYISHRFVANSDNMEIDLEHPCILLYEKMLSRSQELLSLLTMVAQAGESLLIIAPDFESEAVTLLLKMMQEGLKVAAVPGPGFGDRRKAILEDIAVLTGGKLISEQFGLNTKSVGQMLGRAKKVIIEKESTTILHGGGKRQDIEHRVGQIKAQLEGATSDYEREKTRERLAKLAGGAAIVRIGGNTRTEIKESKERADKALRSVRAALEEGILPGGGIAYLRAAKALAKLQPSNDDEKIATPARCRFCRHAASQRD